MARRTGVSVSQVTLSSPLAHGRGETPSPCGRKLPPTLLSQWKEIKNGGRKLRYAAPEIATDRRTVHPPWRAEHGATSASRAILSDCCPSLPQLEFGSLSESSTS